MSKTLRDIVEHRHDYILNFSHARGNSYFLIKNKKVIDITGFNDAGTFDEWIGQDENDVKKRFKTVTKNKSLTEQNPYHVPAGTPEGGQFTTRHGVKLRVSPERLALLNVMKRARESGIRLTVSILDNGDWYVSGFYMLKNDPHYNPGISGPQVMRDLFNQADHWQKKIMLDPVAEDETKQEALQRYYKNLGFEESDEEGTYMAYVRKPNTVVEWRLIYEYNPYHKSAGTPEGGQFTYGPEMGGQQPEPTEREILKDIEKHVQHEYGMYVTLSSSRIRKHAWYLNSFYAARVSSKYQRGISGAMAMHYIFDKADQYGKTIILAAVAAEKKNQAKLELYYKNLGFKWDSETEIFMREPLIIQQADEFATHAHRYRYSDPAGQYRKYTHEPYVEHCREVANILRQHNRPAEEISAALLHDTVEDTNVTNDEIKELFGPIVAQYVDEVTDRSMFLPKNEKGQYVDEHGNRMNRDKRKAMDRDHIARASQGGQNVKCADLISNTRSIVTHDKNFAKVYLQEKRALLNIMHRASPLLLQAAWNSLEMGENLLKNNI